MDLFGLILYAFYITHCTFSDLLNKCSIFLHIVGKHVIYIMCMCTYLILKTILFSFENTNTYSFNYLVVFVS